MRSKKHRQSLMPIIVSYVAYRWIFAILTYGVLVIYDFLKFKHTELVIEDDMIKFTTGVFRTTTRKISYEHIDEIGFTQSSLGRKTHSGVLNLKLSDDSTIELKFVENPKNLVEIIENKAGKSGASICNPAATTAEWRSLVKGSVNDATIKEVQASCHQDEKPKYIIGDGINGTLAIFDDRCIIIKKGAATSFMSGRFGGGMTATFDYLDITGIEYNTGILTGVLEILTASYSGRETNSPWDFKTDRSAHAASNMLPWGKIFYSKVRPQIEDMKQKTREAKRK